MVGRSANGVIALSDFVSLTAVIDTPSEEATQIRLQRRRSSLVTASLDLSRHPSLASIDRSSLATASLDLSRRMAAETTALEKAYLAELSAATKVSREVGPECSSVQGFAHKRSLPPSWDDQRKKRPAVPPAAPAAAVEIEGEIVSLLRSVPGIGKHIWPQDGSVTPPNYYTSSSSSASSSSSGSDEEVEGAIAERLCGWMCRDSYLGAVHPMGSEDGATAYTVSAVDDDGKDRIVFASEGFTQLTGWSSEDILGKSLLDRSSALLKGLFTSDEALDQLSASFHETLQTREVGTMQMFCGRRDKSNWWNLLHTWPLQSNARHILTTHRDMTKNPILPL